jgi:hypothetical protein
MSDNASMNFGATIALASGALAAGTTAGTVKTTVAIPYALDGQFYSKAITDNIAIAYTGPEVYQAPTGVGSVNGAFTGGIGGATRLYLLCFNAAGTVSVTPGKIVNSAELAAGRVSLDFPDAPFNQCPFGAVRIAVTANTSFIPGTTALNAAGVTASYLNLATVPANPLTA